MITSKSCGLFGAQQALCGIKGNLTIFHSVVGCHFGSLGLHLAGNMSYINQVSTIINDKDIVFNGENSLRTAIDHSIKLYNPETITIVTGCVSEIIGDDIERIVNDFNSSIPLIYINGAGFDKDFEEGYESSLVRYAKTVVAEGKKNNVPTINIFGYLCDEYLLDGDINEIRKILGEKVQIQCITGSCEVSDMKKLSIADLNIVFGRGEKIAQHLKEKFNIPYFNLNYPYGIEGMKTFLNVLEKHFNIDFSYELREMENEVTSGIKKVFSYLQKFYGIPVQLHGSIMKREGMKMFLEKELGMDCFNFDLYAETAMVFGSSFERRFTDKFQVPLIQYEYPVFDKVSLGLRSHIGGEGTLNLIEDILNGVMSGPKNKGAFYREKNMCIW